jgi:hypothetical protein
MRGLVMAPFAFDFSGHRAGDFPGHKAGRERASFRSIKTAAKTTTKTV